MSSGHEEDAIDFAELFPFLNIEGDADADANWSSELPDGDLMELLRSLDDQLQAQQVQQTSSQMLADGADKQRGDRSKVEPLTAIAPATRTGPTESKSPPETPRVSTYTARKQEIAKLLKELPHLESYVDYLTHKAAKAHNQKDSLEKTRLVNDTLRESIHRQQYTFARLQSAMSLYRTRQERMIPMDMFVHLPTESGQRHRTVSALRPRILRDMLRFMRERTWFVDLSASCIEQVAFTGASDDRCAVKFCVSPVEGSPDVKQVFDALMFYISHTDIMMTEATGDVTTREDATDFTECEASQSRQVRVMANGYQVESNSLVYANYQPQDYELGDGRALGIVVVTAVGHDDLYPFSPDSRLRKDLTTIMVIKTYARRASEDRNSSEETSATSSRSPFGVALVRYSFLRVHRGNVEISQRELSELCDRLLVEGNVLFDTVQASVDDTVVAQYPNDSAAATGRAPTTLGA